MSIDAQELGYLKGKIESVEERTTKIEEEQKELSKKLDCTNDKLDQVLVNQSVTKQMFNAAKVFGAGILLYTAMQFDMFIKFLGRFFS